MKTKEIRSISWVKKDLEGVFQVNLKETHSNITIAQIWDTPNSECRISIYHKPILAVINVIELDTFVSRVE